MGSGIASVKPRSIVGRLILGIGSENEKENVGN
jgi:hypothetical protein